MNTKLHIDVETFSSIDLKTSGAYKYTESIDFEILLFAYAFNNDPVKIVDLAQGEKLPIHVQRALADPLIKKYAHNAVFERQAILNGLGLNIPIEEWYCSAVKASYCGLPRSLEEISKALNLEHAKLSSGKELIRYFSKPCKGSKANNYRRRNLPFHDFEKWEAFKLYCIQDVEAEREIYNELAEIEIPNYEVEAYQLDQKINDTGILIDLDLAKKAQKLDLMHSNKLKLELKNITGLENPNSSNQLKEWLGFKMKKEIKSLTKESIPKLKNESGCELIERALTIKQSISKTSIKKYTSMELCVGADDRARGLFQFYGAKTGRWAGRLIQLQNLPKNFIRNLDDARNCVLAEDYSRLQSDEFKGVSNTLSELIRTAFVPKPNYIFGVLDFSAIEARVLSWLANEKWRLDVFNTHGKIYEASASKMFNVPLESIDKGSSYRTKGKIAELALGYGGSLGAMKKMGGEKMGLNILEMENVVKEWRLNNRKITNFWKDLETYAIHAIKRPFKLLVGTPCNLVFHSDKKQLTITLPSGRALFYREPKIGIGKFGNECILFKGLHQKTGQWVDIDTYGGKLAENVVQAVARDILVESMRNTMQVGFSIVMHVHDELIFELLKNKAENDLKVLTNIMSAPVSWAKGLPLAADGYLTDYYKKED